MHPFSDWDFTLTTYAGLCDALLDAGYAVLTVADLLEAGQHDAREPFAVLRHDVDRRPLWAGRMAAVEAQRGISSTYYFRARPHTFRPDVMRSIAARGHEIGYHYESLSDAKGDVDAALEDFRSNLISFRRLTPIRTVCMHGSPLSPWDNRDLWKHHSWTDFGILGEPYFSLDYSSLVYVTDTGRRWNSQSGTNIRDRVSAATVITPRSTADLVGIVRSKEHRRLMIQCHPERWALTPPEWIWSYSCDAACNMIKRIIATLWVR